MSQGRQDRCEDDFMTVAYFCKLLKNVYKVLRILQGSALFCFSKSKLNNLFILRPGLGGKQ